MRKLLKMEWVLIGSPEDIAMLEKQIMDLTRSEEVSGMYIEVVG